ncbi:hypothetical protein [Collimonas sp. PA-H2]|nr:hypothetical protein [Collimonas sp. PA-H2]
MFESDGVSRKSEIFDEKYENSYGILKKWLKPPIADQAPLAI